MATSAGIDAQLGIAEEVTYNTFVAPARYYELVSESLKFNIARINSAGIRPGRHVMHRWKAGAKSVTGDIVMELAPQEAGLIFNHLLGDAVTSGSGPYTHTYSGPKNNNTSSLSVQVGRPDESGTVRAFSYTGMRITQAVIDASIDQFVRLTTSWYGANEVTSESLGTASYDAELEPFVFTEGTLEVADSIVPVSSFSLTINRNLATDRHRIQGSPFPKKAMINGLAEITGSFTADFESLTQYNRYVDGTESKLELILNANTDCQVLITMNVRYDGETPTVDGPGILDLPQQFVATSGTSDADAFTLALINNDITA